MQKIIFTLCLSLFIFQFANAQEIQIKSLNTAMARALGHDFNPCVRERMETILRETLTVADKPTVMMYQEVFYSPVHNAMAKWAKENGYYITKSNAVRSGLVILSNLPILEEKLEPFSCSQRMEKLGTLSVKLDLNGKEINVTDVHTYYSEGEKPNPCHLQNLKELKARVDLTPSPKIFGGDINSGPDLELFNQKYSQLEVIWKPFLKALGPLWTRASTPAGEATWDIIKNPLAYPYVHNDPKQGREGDHGNATLDHIFVDPNFKVLNATVIYNKPVEINGCQVYQVEPEKLI